MRLGRVSELERRHNDSMRPKEWASFLWEGGWKRGREGNGRDRPSAPQMDTEELVSVSESSGKGR